MEIGELEVRQRGAVLQLKNATGAPIQVEHRAKRVDRRNQIRRGFEDCRESRTRGLGALPFGNLMLQRFNL